MGTISKEKDIKKYKIKDLCEDHGISYHKLGAILGVTGQTVYSWSCINYGDIKSIPGDSPIRMAHIFKISVEKLHNEAHYKTLKVTAA